MKSFRWKEDEPSHKARISGEFDFRKDGKTGKLESETKKSNVVKVNF